LGGFVKISISRVLTGASLIIFGVAVAPIILALIPSIGRIQFPQEWGPSPAWLFMFWIVGHAALGMATGLFGVGASLIQKTSPARAVIATLLNTTIILLFVVTNFVTN
jgi:hypothetical protein